MLAEFWIYSYKIYAFTLPHPHPQPQHLQVFHNLSKQNSRYLEIIWGYKRTFIQWNKTVKLSRVSLVWRNRLKYWLWVEQSRFDHDRCSQVHQARKEVWVIHPRGRFADIKEFEIFVVLPYVAHHATFVTKLPLRTEKQKYPCRYEIYIIAFISPTTIKNERLYFQYFNIDGA